MKAVERTARKPHRCAMCRRGVRPGEQYIVYTTFPGEGACLSDRPYRFAECRDCINERAARRGAPIVEEVS